jgi:hypothetical protein
MEDIKPNLRRKAPAKGTASLDSSSSTASDAFVPVSDEDEDTKSSKPRSRPWTAEEYLAVLDGVTKHGAGPKAFADIPGRTSHQAASAWR